MTKLLKRVVRNTGGFTFVELLVSLLIVVMLSMIVATGIPVAFETYTKAVDGSNAQAALSTTTAKLRNELAYAQNVQVDSDGRVVRYLTSDGYWASIGEDNSYKSLVKHVYIGESGNAEADGSPTPLLQDAAVTERMEIVFSDSADSGIFYDDGVFSVYGLEVSYIDDGTVLVDIGDGDVPYRIKALSL